MTNLSDKTIQVLIFIIGCFLYIPFIGQSHLFDWDEINFAEAAREMLVTKDWLTVQINYLPFWEKPPLFIWMQAISMKIFGVNEFAARFPNAVCGVVTLLVLFRLGRSILNSKLGLLWSLLYACSILPFLYFKSGIIDPWFNLFIFLGIYYIAKFTFSEISLDRYKFVGLSALFIGLGVLTKGPVALLIFGLVTFIYFVTKKFRVKFSFGHILLFSIIFLLVGGFWFILQLLNGNIEIVKDFFEYQIRLFQTEDAGHGGFLFYHFVVLFVGVFPASIYAFLNFNRFRKDERKQFFEFKNWMLILFWTVLILFTIVKTKIIHYSSLGYFPLTFIAAFLIYKQLEQKETLPKWIKILVLFVGFLWSLIVVVIQIIAANKEEIIKMKSIKDEFALGNLQANVHWSGFEFLIGLLFFVALVFVFVSKRFTVQNQIIGSLFITLIFIYSTIVVIIPRVEGYTQNAAITFYKSRQGEACYVKTVGFKSYADLFYAAKTPTENLNANNEDWLIFGEIDKPVYFVMKNTRSEEFERNFPHIKRLFEKNGFVFYKRNTNRLN
jgi:4-amino-4-deoxy-L-arabinose transferase-like glycosyltransferase